MGISTQLSKTPEPELLTSPWNFVKYCAEKWTFLWLSLLTNLVLSKIKKQKNATGLMWILSESECDS